MKSRLTQKVLSVLHWERATTQQSKAQRSDISLAFMESINSMICFRSQSVQQRFDKNHSALHERLRCINSTSSRYRLCGQSHLMTKTTLPMTITNGECMNVASAACFLASHSVVAVIPVYVYPFRMPFRFAAKRHKRTTQT